MASSTTADAPLGEGHQHAATVVGVGTAANEAVALEAIHHQAEPT